MSLMEMIKASKSNADLEEWSNLPKKSDSMYYVLANCISNYAYKYLHARNISIMESFFLN